MTPAETLRAAATRLRELAVDVTDRRWSAEVNPDGRAWINTCTSPLTQMRTTPMGRTQDHRHCICGGSVKAVSSNHADVAFVMANFDRIHSGDGHESCTAAESARARRRDVQAALILGDDHA